MKKMLFLYCFFMGGIFASAANESPMDLTDVRQDYKKIVAEEKKSIATDWGAVYSEQVLSIVTNALAQRDEEVNKSLIEYLHIKAFRYFKNSTLISPDQQQLDALSQISGLKKFLLEQLQYGDFNNQLAPILLVFYGESEEVTEQLVQWAVSSDTNSMYLVNAFLFSDIYTEEIDSPILIALSSDNMNISVIAARYLERFPVPTALPQLISQYRFAGIEGSLPQSTNTPPNIGDITQSIFGRAVLSYPSSELIKYKCEIEALGADGMGPLTRAGYESILLKIKGER